MSDIRYLVSELEKKSWQEECQIIEKIFLLLKEKKLPHSMRIVGEVIGHSKAYASISLELARHFKVYPRLEEQSTRNKAYKYLLKQKNLERFINS